jgi:hypothetical protein
MTLGAGEPAQKGLAMLVGNLDDRAVLGVMGAYIQVLVPSMAEGRKGEFQCPGLSANLTASRTNTADL